MPTRLRAQYPQEMTIVLQHQFWDLAVDEEAGMHERRPVVRRRAQHAGIPLAAVTAFADPYVRYGLRFRAERRRAARPSRTGRAGARAANPTPRAGTAPRPPGGQPGRVPPPHPAQGRADRTADERRIRPPRPIRFLYAPMFPLGADATPWRKLDIAGVSTATCDGRTVLKIAPEALSELAFQAFRDVSHLLRPAHLAQLRAILDDPEASANDRFVALDLLKNANIAAGGVLPMCQDTGTAIVFGKKGQRVWVEGDEEEALSCGVHRTYTETNLRYSQMAPLTMFEEVNTGNNLPVQFDIYGRPRRAPRRRVPSDVRRQGRRLGQQDLPVPGNPRDPVRRRSCCVPRDEDEDARHLGLPALPPGHRHRRHRAETTLKTVKLASTKWLDALPTAGSKAGHAFRDLEMEAEGAGD